MKRAGAPRSLVTVFALGLAACGYQPVHGAFKDARLHVVLASTQVADPIAADEVVAGVRDALARRGALAAGDGYPRCEIEILRADEASEGIAALPNQDGRLVPQSRATRVGVVARAWVTRTAGGDRERDTGDVRAMETVAVARDATSASFRHSDALRAAGRRLGHRLGDRLLGLPAATEE